ncbi:MAG: DUF6273 domain-containing protein [Lachnospiraceae bacterium]
MERFYQTIKKVKANGADITNSKKFIGVLSDYLGQNYVSECRWLKQAMDKGTHLEFVNYKNASLSEKRQLVSRVSQQLENVDGYNKNTVEKIIISLMILGEWRENYKELISKEKVNTSVGTKTQQKIYQPNQNMTNSNVVNIQTSQTVINNKAMNTQTSQVPISNQTNNTYGSTKNIPMGGVIAIVACVLIGFAILFIRSSNPETAMNGSNSNINSSLTREKNNVNINANEWDYVTFGNLEWLVVKKEGNRELLLTKESVGQKPYNDSLEDITWEQCTLRQWLNGEFYNETFSEEEKAMIEVTRVINEDNPEYGTQGGNDTDDKVFLLSHDEVWEYFGQDAEDAEEKRAMGEWWWTRSVGYHNSRTIYIKPDGMGPDTGYDVHIYGAVRPAIWVQTS